jgi:hypothetical protein
LDEESWMMPWNQARIQYKVMVERFNEIMYIQNQFNMLNVDITRLMKDFPIIHFTRGNIPKVFVNLIRETYTSEIKSCLNMLRNL